MDAPLVDDASNFFFLDTVLRLTRLAEVACGYTGFVLLLYCRTLCPGGLEVWRWLVPGPLWALVFAPLFLLDWRSLLHWKYLRSNHRRFSSQDGRRYLLVCITESIFKVLLCIHLMFKSVRPYLTFKIVMFPYAVGYVLHFVLGHFVPLEDADRAEGCNMVAGVLSDLTRFLGFILLVSLSLKIESSAASAYDWQAAFWPCWGLEGIILLVTALLLPICLTSTCADQQRVLMLTWVILSSLCFGTACFISVVSVVKVLDNDLCPELPCSLSGSVPGCEDCRQRLEMVFWPWLAFLPTFAVSTMLFKRRLASALHEAWYQPVRADPEPDGRGGSRLSPLPLSDLPVPPVLFRVTATYFARTCEAVLRDAEPAAFQSTHSLHRMSLDPSTSILSARGSAFTDIVESEQLCFICYSEAPDAVLLECGHAGLCSTCALHLVQRRAGAHCPICRSAIGMIVRLRPDLPVPSDLFLRERPTPETGPSAAAGILRLSAGDPEVGSMDAPLQQHGPPWPPAAKRTAMVVEPVRGQTLADFRWW
mmetsp:Transcript_90745/g.270857  ORF Transcript_90745/g.270857 Transcript_90745/m.270857 type:complete len:535 (-) Transcript_90745:48-1652(-)